MAIDGQLIGLLGLADPLRLEASAVVHALRARGVQEVVMLTGDHAAVAKKVGDALGITRYIAEALPEQKAELVRALPREGHTVAVVGDGINDVFESTSTAFAAKSASPHASRLGLVAAESHWEPRMLVAVRRSTR